MRIAVSGVHAIGKTSLVEWISKNYDIKMIPEQARYHLENGFPFSEVEKHLEVFKKFQLAVLEGQYTDLKSIGEAGFVMDRTPVDSLAYVEARLAAEKALDIPYFFSYEKEVAFIMKDAYDFIFFLPFNLEDVGAYYNPKDEFRNLNPIYMKELSDLIELNLRNHASSKVHLLPHFGSLNERIQYIRGILG